VTASHEEILSRPHYVYRVFGRGKRPLYIGSSSNLDRRRYDHSRTAPWFDKAVRWEITGPHDYRTARDLEIAAIHAERPRFNLTGRVVNYPGATGLRGAA
jgi:excinuclease UvrABC nuclease subunit